MNTHPSAPLASSDGDQLSSLETKSGVKSSTDDSSNKCDTIELDSGLHDRLVQSHDIGVQGGQVLDGETDLTDGLARSGDPVLGDKIVQSRHYGLEDGLIESSDPGLKDGLVQCTARDTESKHGYTDVVDLICTEQVNYSSESQSTPKRKIKQSQDLVETDPSYATITLGI